MLKRLLQMDEKDKKKKKKKKKHHGNQISLSSCLATSMYLGMQLMNSFPPC